MLCFRPKTDISGQVVEDARRANDLLPLARWALGCGTSFQTTLSSAVAAIILTDLARLAAGAESRADDTPFVILEDLAPDRR
jgi:hypothetical protein